MLTADPAALAGEWSACAAELGRSLAVSLPRSAVRRGELSISPRGTLAVSAALRRPLAREELRGGSLLRRIPPGVAERVEWFRGLGCWRHIVRVDEEGGLALYCERDMDEATMARLCAWTATSTRLARIAALMDGTAGFAVFAAGVHWTGTGRERLRLYVVARPRAGEWATSVRGFLALCAAGGIAADDALLATLEARPRRALLLNLELRDEGLAVKLELPGLRWDEVSAATGGLPGDEPAWREVLARWPRGVRYLGTRLQARRPPEVTIYLPFDVHSSLAGGADVVHQRRQAHPPV